jgi:hypothetical protein
VACACGMSGKSLFRARTKEGHRKCMGLGDFVFLFCFPYTKEWEKKQSPCVSYKGMKKKRSPLPCTFYRGKQRLSGQEADMWHVWCVQRVVWSVACGMCVAYGMWVARGGVATIITLSPSPIITTHPLTTITIMYAITIQSSTIQSATITITHYCSSPNSTIVIDTKIVLTPKHVLKHLNLLRRGWVGRLVAGCRLEVHPEDRWEWSMVGLVDSV